jgi:DNA-binding MltR family transcriptional regulator
MCPKSVIDDSSNPPSKESIAKIVELLDRFEKADSEFIESLKSDEYRAEMLFATFEGAFRDIGVDVKSARELLDLRVALTSETDRGCALMAVAYLDQELRRLLTSFLVKDDETVKRLFEGYGPLSSLSSRIDLAYCLGLLSKPATRDLNLVRKIRNSYAHLSKKIDFDTIQIKNQCNELAYAGPILNEDDNRAKFISAVLGLAAHILVGIQKASNLEPREHVIIKNAD